MNIDVFKTLTTVLIIYGVVLLPGSKPPISYLVVCKFLSEERPQTGKVFSLIMEKLKDSTISI